MYYVHLPKYNEYMKWVKVHSLQLKIHHVPWMRQQWHTLPVGLMRSVTLLDKKCLENTSIIWCEMEYISNADIGTFPIAKKEFIPTCGIVKFIFSSEGIGDYSDTARWYKCTRLAPRFDPEQCAYWVGDSHSTTTRTLFQTLWCTDWPFRRKSSSCSHNCSSVIWCRKERKGGKKKE